MSDYQIIRVDSRPGIDGVADLEIAAKAAVSEGWQAVGGPFYDSASMKWCQALTRPAFYPRGPADPAAMQLREPEQIPGFPRVHADPKDGPMKFREPK